MSKHITKSIKKKIGNFMMKIKKSLSRKRNTNKSKSHSKPKSQSKGKTYNKSKYISKVKRSNTKKRTLRKHNSRKSLKGGSCDEYAFVNEPSVNIPEHNGVPGLSIASKRASIGKVKTCAPVNHA